MSKSTSFWEHPIAKLEEALNLRKQIDSLQKRMSALMGGNSAPSSAPAKSRGRRKMSAAARAKIGAAQRARWAKVKKSSGPNAEPAPKKAKRAGKKGGITPAGRAKLAAAMRARWAARKKAAASSKS